jgi:hypothetical protein
MLYCVKLKFPSTESACVPLRDVIALNNLQDGLIMKLSGTAFTLTTTLTLAATCATICFSRAVLAEQLGDQRVA